MNIDIILDISDKAPIYKQLVEQFEESIRSGKLKPGEQVPSMNHFSMQMGISKETVKKAYGILSEKGLLVPKQGKGFYVAESYLDSKPKVLVLFDKLSIYKEVLYNSLAEELGEHADLTILTHNQNSGKRVGSIPSHLCSISSPPPNVGASGSPPRWGHY